MAHTKMCQEYPVSFVKLSFYFIQVKIIQIIQVFDFDNWHPLNIFFIQKRKRESYCFLQNSMSENICYTHG